MSHHHKLRKDKTCLNCGHEVDDRYCTHCGQENIEPRQPFHYLFGHFMEDLTHYDHGFWQTFKTLMVCPGKLIKNYLAGKRQSQVPPVKLYIFVSFVAFFLPAILPKPHSEKNTAKGNEKIAVENRKEAVENLENALAVPFLTNEEKAKIQQQIDSLKVGNLAKAPVDTSDDSKDEDLIVNGKFTSKFPVVGWMYNESAITSVKQLDSLQEALPKEKRASYLDYTYLKKKFELKEDGVTDKEMREKFIESFVHNLPKLLFFYLPVFAFFLWIFHNKKKWLYFDHGIFTLYYFSFLLTSIIILELLIWLGGYVHVHFLNIIVNILTAFLVLYPFFYFFRSHSRVYGERKSVSRLKGISLFVINLIFMLLFGIAYTIITFSTMH